MSRRSTRVFLRAAGRAAFCVFLAASVVAACGTSGDDTGDDVIRDRDAGPVSTRDAGPVTPAVEVGTGQDFFVPLEDGDSVELIAGPQGGGRNGGHHIWSAMRIYGIAKADIMLLTFEIADIDGDVRAMVSRTGAAPIQTDAATGALQLIAVPPIIDDCCLLANQQAILRAILTTNGGTTYTDAVTVSVSACPGPSEPGPNLCP